MTFQPSSSNGARWRLIETNGVLFAVLKCWVLQKRNRPPHDKTSGLSFDKALFPHEYKNLHGNSRWANKWTSKERKKYIQSDQPAWKPGETSATPKPRKFPVLDCAVALYTLQNILLVTNNLTWLDSAVSELSPDALSRGGRCLFCCARPLTKRKEHATDCDQPQSRAMRQTHL
jgi:hypothetical protein